MHNSKWRDRGLKIFSLSIEDLTIGTIMFSFKKSLNEATAEVERLLSSKDWNFGYSPEALAATTERMTTLKKSLLQGTRRCSTKPLVKKLVEKIDYAKCHLIAAEYFQKQIARATDAGDPPYALEELKRCNKDAIDNAAKKLNDGRLLWNEVKENHFRAARTR